MLSYLLLNDKYSRFKWKTIYSCFTNKIVMFLTFIHWGYVNNGVDTGVNTVIDMGGNNGVDIGGHNGVE